MSLALYMCVWSHARERRQRDLEQDLYRTVYLDGAVGLAARVLGHAAVRAEVLRLEVPHRQKHVDLVFGIPFAVLDVVLL